MLDKHIYEALAKADVVPEPKLPKLEALVKKMRSRGCGVEVKWPSDDGEDIQAVVVREGRRFSGTEAKVEEALAVAAYECIKETEPAQLSFGDPNAVNAEALADLDDEDDGDE